MGGAVSWIRGNPKKGNPTFEDIKTRQNAERSRSEGKATAEAAGVQMDQAQQDAELLRTQARTGRAKAAAALTEVAGEIQRIKTRLKEAEEAKKCAEEFAKASAKDAERSAQDVLEERERVQKIREEAERAIATAREEAERAIAAAREEAEMAKRVADEQRRVAEASMARAQELSSMLAEEVQKAKRKKEEAEERLKKGIQPVVTPSPMELAEAKSRIQYRKDCFHFAVAGVSGSGKSSLVNAFRGLRNSDPRSAAVGVMETTLTMARYQDVNPDNPFVWYDIPGAGTLTCPDWQYFHNHGLYVFDCIIVLIDSRFTMTDLAILINARRFNIPTYIVRSKADQHIRNTMNDMDCESDEEEEGNCDRVYKAARKQFIDQTRRNVQANLQDANFEYQRVYIVSNSALLNVVMNKMPKNAIDEVELVNDLVNQAYGRRNF